MSDSHSVDVVQLEYRDVFEQIENEGDECRRKSCFEPKSVEPVDKNPVYWYDNRGVLHSNILTE